MSYGVGTFLAGDVHQSLGNEGPGNGSAEQVAAFVDGCATHHGKDKIFGHLFAQVNHIGFGSAGFKCLFFHAGEIFRLAQIGGDGNDLAFVGLNKPFQDNRCIKPAGVGENNFFYVLHYQAPL